jgi:rSAM/selenodomain-associated transferase 2
MVDAVTPVAAQLISIIVPVLNESANIAQALQRLQPLRARGHEVMVVDGGSQDGTAELAQPLADRVLHAPRGRARQMNAGAHEARGELLLFLHADTRLPDEADGLILQAAMRGAAWGWFDVVIEGKHWLLRVIAWSMNLRSRLTSVCTGDQSVFVKRELFQRVRGFPDIDLMEDIALSKLLRRIARPVVLTPAAVTSGRRWEKRGVWRTMLLMWWLRARYVLGTSPSRLQRIYEGNAR